MAEAALHPVSRQRRADLILLFITVIWGSTFPAVKAALSFASPLFFVAVRMGIAALLLFYWARPLFQQQARPVWRDGALLGFFMALGLVTQTVGLGLTSASRSGFLTALYVVFTPLFQFALLRRIPSSRTVGACAVVVVGLYFMALPDGDSALGLLETLLTGLNAGDLWTLACAVFFTVYLLLMDSRAEKHDAVQLTIVQLVVGSLTAALGALLFESPRFVPRTDMLAAVIYLSFFATTLPVLLQTRFQRDTTATRSAIIFSMEAVFSAILSAWLAGEVMGTFEGLGGAMIVSGLIISEITKRERVAS